MTSTPFVTVEWLAAHRDDPGVRLVDGSWHLPPTGRNGRGEYEAGHIAGAVFFDIDKIADPSSGLPHMLPSPEVFAETVGAMGISELDIIIVYDGTGLFSAPRVRWTFKVFGAQDVRLLEGGLPAWKAAGMPLTSEIAKPTPARFNVSFDKAAIVTLESVRGSLQDASAQVLDARPADRFRGDAPEPRPGVRSGHIPGSRNLPFTEVVKDGRLADAATLEAAFQRAGVDLDRPIITSCGSGVSAAILALGLETIGKPAKAIYDGAWAEWGSRTDTPIARG